MEFSVVIWDVRKNGAPPKMRSQSRVFQKSRLWVLFFSGYPVPYYTVGAGYFPCNDVRLGGPLLRRYCTNISVNLWNVAEYRVASCKSCGCHQLAPLAYSHPHSDLRYLKTQISDTHRWLCARNLKQSATTWPKGMTERYFVTEVFGRLLYETSMVSYWEE